MVPRDGIAEADPGEPVQGVLFDLLMAIMDSLAVWSAAAGGRGRGLRWRDEVTARMIAARVYVPYEDLVAEAASAIGLGPRAVRRFFDRWPGMAPWPDVPAVERLHIPYGFVTNCSTSLARIAARRSGLHPRSVLSAEDAGRYKPDAAIYREACRRLGTPPERTSFVAGSPYDAEGARDAGLRTWLVQRRRDQPLPDGSIRSATSLDAIIDAIGGGAATTAR
jgi:2-haloalkanoic acid dehalogenase type II